MSDHIGRCKKKLDTELRQFFPSRYSDGGNVNIFSELKRETIAIHQSIIADFEERYEDRNKLEKVIRSIEDYILSRNPPRNFIDNSSDNSLIQMDLSFGKLCASLEEAGIKEPKNLTVFDFNTKLDYFQEKAKRAEK